MNTTNNTDAGLDQFHDTCFIIDFGLARRYVLSNGEVRPPRESTGFRGTARYASINSHLGNELARRDDLWSLVYVMVEFTRGQLPWRRIKEKEHIGEYKQRIPMLELLDGLPVELWDIVQVCGVWCVLCRVLCVWRLALGAYALIVLCVCVCVCVCVCAMPPICLLVVGC